MDKPKRRAWTRNELIVAFNLYCRTTFTKINYKNTAIIDLAFVINRTPSAVAWKLVNFASLDPSIIKRGFKGASNTSKLDKIIFNEFINNWDKLVLESEYLLNKYFNNSQIDKDKIFRKPLEIKEGKEVQRIVKVRTNQSFFREMILSTYNYKCCITGIDQPELLIASHIKPWSQDKENRLNPQNGLCLNNLHDKAFDRGLISFNENYEMLVSNKLKKSEATNIYFRNLEGKQINLPNRFLPDKEFLKFHLDNIYQK